MDRIRIIVYADGYSYGAVSDALTELRDSNSLDLWWFSENVEENDNG